MRFPRRQFLQLAAGATALPAALRIASAQTSYPARPITMIVSGPAGGPSDAMGRILAERIGKSLRQAIIIENVGGAVIGAGRAVRARPDGYTIDLGYLSNHVLNGAFFSLQYDLLNDFAPISPLATSSLVLFARKAMPANDLNELIAWLKANPNKASAAITALASHLLPALLQKETGTQFTLVPYRGTASNAGLGGRSDRSNIQLPLVQAGNIKVYAVTSEKRLSIAPTIATFRELGLPTLTFLNWYGLFAPKGTPRDIIGKLNAAAAEALVDPAVQSRLSDLGFEVFPRKQQTPEALGELMKADAEKWWPIIKELGISATSTVPVPPR
jgi:tripartite-type tricarboxylate transporter receptor subunit TctC